MAQGCRHRGGGVNKEFARNSQGRRPRWRPIRDQPPAHRADFHQAGMSMIQIRSLRQGIYGEEDCAFCQRVHRHVQQAGEIGDGPPMPKAKVISPMLDRGIGEHALDVPLVTGRRPRPPPTAAEAHHQMAGERARRAPSSTLQRKSAYCATLSNRPESTADYRCRAFHARQAASCAEAPAPPGAVAHQQENERERHHCRPGGRRPRCPQRALPPAPSTLPEAEHSRMVPNSARGDAHAAEDEIFPRRLQPRRRAVQTHQQDGGERGSRAPPTGCRGCREQHHSMVNTNNWYMLERRSRLSLSLPRAS